MGIDACIYICPAGSTGTGNVVQEMQCGGTCVCSGSRALSGVISDGQGTLSEFGLPSYFNNANCWWIISGISPSVSFTSFQTESYSDYVYVEQSADATFSSGVLQLAKLDGDGALNTYTATNQYLRVRFTSDGSVQKNGFTASWDSGGSLISCSACVAGTYKDAEGAAACQPCPANSESSSGSALCQCSAGFTGNDGGPCSPCLAMEYKQSVGSGSCTVCPANSGIQQCQCPEGFEQTDVDGETCSLCDTDKYKATVGSGSCTACPLHTSSVTSVGTDCACVAGFTADEVMQCGGTCGCLGSLAENGVISDGEGDYSRFDNCWWIISGARPSVTFTSFQTVKTWDRVIVAESDDATFLNGFNELAWLDGNPGEYGRPALAEMTYTATKLHMRVTFIPAGSDTPTSGGFTANWASGGSVLSCSACKAGSYKATEFSVACTACPPHTSSTEGSDELIDCKCVEGYTADSNGLECSECDAGTFKSVGGTAACEACPANSESSSGSTLCLCSAQFTGNDGGPCSACAMGTDKASVGSASCVEWPVCTANSNRYLGTAVCYCNAGYIGNNDGPCTACDPGTFKTEAGTGWCEPCPAGTFNDASGAEICEVCPNTTSSFEGKTDSSDCVCMEGYGGVFTEDPPTCIACDAGKYKDAIGWAACGDCPDRTSSVQGSISQTNCVCAVGFTTASGGVDCIACDAGTFKDAIGSAACQLCLTGATSLPGSDEVADCKCAAGFTGDGGEIQCTSCLAGTYKEGVGTGACQGCGDSMYLGVGCKQCPWLTWCASGTCADQTECSCIAGYTGEYISCSKCAEGTYKNTTGSVCTPCPLHSTSVAGSTTKASCICDDGWIPIPTWSIVEASTAFCTNCNVGTYEKDDACVTCPANMYCIDGMGYGCPTHSTSLTGSGKKEDCICDTGRIQTPAGEEFCTMCGWNMYQTEYGGCDACPVNMYCIKGVVYNCPAHTTSGWGSGKKEDCICGAGRIHIPLGEEFCTFCGLGMYKFVDPQTENGSCETCPANAYCINGIAYPCPPNTQSSAGSQSITDCLCTSGYYHIA